MCVNFDVNTHLISEICQDNKKLVNIFYSALVSHSETQPTAWRCNGGHSALCRQGPRHKLRRQVQHQTRGAVRRPETNADHRPRALAGRWTRAKGSTEAADRRCWSSRHFSAGDSSPAPPAAAVQVNKRVRPCIYFDSTGTSARWRKRKHQDGTNQVSPFTSGHQTYAEDLNLYELFSRYRVPARVDEHIATGTLLMLEQMYLSFRQLTFQSMVNIFSSLKLFIFPLAPCLSEACRRFPTVSRLCFIWSVRCLTRMAYDLSPKSRRTVLRSQRWKKL